jgi:hypothetical protein
MDPEPTIPDLLHDPPGSLVAQFGLLLGWYGEIKQIIRHPCTIRLVRALDAGLTGQIADLRERHYVALRLLELNVELRTLPDAEDTAGPERLRLDHWADRDMDPELQHAGTHSIELGYPRYDDVFHDYVLELARLALQVEAEGTS